MSLTKLRPAFSLAGSSSTRTSMYRPKQDVGERTYSLKDRLEGREEERKNETNLLFKAVDWWADNVYYRDVYRMKPNSAYPKMAFNDPWLRMFVIDGIPGSGFEDFATRFAEDNRINGTQTDYQEVPDLYYAWNKGRHDTFDTPARRKLYEMWNKGEGPGCIEHYRFQMKWDFFFENPEDWKMACRCIAWQLRNYRNLASNIVLEHLLGMQGVVAESHYFSWRAAIHAFGELGVIPPDMYQSIIDQWQHMEGMIDAPHVYIHVDIDPEEAYDNIQASDKYTDAQKQFYSVEFLQKYKEGMEEFVIPHFERCKVLIFRVTPEQASKENLDYLKMSIQEDHPLMIHPRSNWHPDRFMKTPQYSQEYFNYIDNNGPLNQQDIGHSRFSGVWGGDQLLQTKYMDVFHWDYPRDVVDPGFHEAWDLHNHVDLGVLREVGDGYAKSKGNITEKDKYPLWTLLFKTDHKQIKMCNWHRQHHFHHGQHY